MPVCRVDSPLPGWRLWTSRPEQPTPRRLRYGSSSPAPESYPGARSWSRGARRKPHLLNDYLDGVGNLSVDRHLQSHFTGALEARRKLDVDLIEAGELSVGS